MQETKQRETATGEGHRPSRIEGREEGLNRKDRRALASIDRKIASIDRAIGKAELTAATIENRGGGNGKP